MADLGPTTVFGDLDIYGSLGGAVRLAYSGTDAGAATTIACFLDTDITGESVTVQCLTGANGTSFLNASVPRLAEGDPMIIVKHNGTWYSTTIFTDLDHNILDNLQGGTTDEFYHLTEDENNLVSRLGEDSAGLTFDDISITAGTHNHLEFLLLDGTREMTGNLDAPGYNISNHQITVTVLTDEAINAAIDALGISGGTIILLEGEYVVNSEITIDYDDTTLQGSGKGTILKVPNSTNGTFNIINLSDKNNCVIKDLAVDGNRDNQASGNQVGIYMTAATNIQISNVDVKNIYGTAGDGIRALKTSIPSNIRITNCSVTNCDDDGIDINAATHIRIEGCYIANINDNGIDNEGGEYQIIVNNHFINCDGSGIELEQEESQSPTTTRFCTVAGNTIQDCGIGIRINSGSHNSITGNTIENSTGNGIVLTKHANGGISENNVITGNVIVNSGSNGIEEITGNANSNLIIGNRILGSTTNDITILGTFTQAYDNFTEKNYHEKKIHVYKNTSGGQLVEGDVVVLKSVATADEITTTTTIGNEYVVGIVLETIAIDGTGNVLLKGKTTALKVDGTLDISIGDYLTTFSTAKIAKKAELGDTVFAIALEAYIADDSNGIIDAILIKKFTPSPLQRNGTVLSPRTSGDYIRADRYEIEDANSSIYEASNDMTFVDANTGPISLATLAAAGAASFTGLTDTPGNYSGDAGKSVVVNSGGDGLEFVSAGGSGVVRSGSTVDNTISRWNGADNDSIQGSDVIITDTGDLAIASGNKLYIDGGTNHYLDYASSRIRTVAGGVERVGINSTDTWLKSNAKISNTYGTADATFEIETTTTEGHQALTIDQNDIDQAFIDYQGSTGGTGINNSILTWNGNGEVIGPRNQDTVEEAWEFTGMVMIEINGNKRWMPYYNYIPEAGC